MDLATTHPLLPLWDKLDLLVLQNGFFWRQTETGAYLKPWESPDPAIREVWEQLTHPKNLPALKHWAMGVESFNPFAKGCTLRALEECRSRSNPKKL